MSLKRVAVGITGLTYYDCTSNIINRWKKGSEPNITRASGGSLSGAAAFTGGYLRADTGELVSPASVGGVAATSITRLFFTPPDTAYMVNEGGNDFSGEPWTIEFDGESTASIGGLTSGAVALSMSTANKGIFTMGTEPGNTWLTLTIPNVNNPPRHVRVYQSRYAEAFASGQKFVPEWIAEIAKYGSVRLGPGWQQVNDEIIEDFDQLADENYDTWGGHFTTDPCSTGPKGNVHPSLICDLAIAAGLQSVHVCIPYMATDACVLEYAEFFRDHSGLAALGTIPAFEWGNEQWNRQFRQHTYCEEQGEAIWPGDGERAYKWAGYRAAQVMKIIRDAYGGSAGRARWEGALATQTAALNVTENLYIGVDEALESMPGLVASDLFNDLYVTGYFGDVIGCKGIEDCTKTNPAVITSTNHFWPNGKRVAICVHADDGMVELDGFYAVLANVTTNTAELQGINSTGFSTMLKPVDGHTRNSYMAPAEFFDLIDESIQANLDDDETYPTKYDLYNQVIADAMITGEAESPEGVVISVAISVAELRQTIWPAQRNLASARNMGLRQYEGGWHFVGDIYLNGYPNGNTLGSKFAEFMIQAGHSAPIAGAYRDAFKSFYRLGGRLPSKFVIDGGSNRYGTWGTIRSWPTAANGSVVDSNPILDVVHDFNENPQPDTYVTSFSAA